MKKIKVDTISSRVLLTLLASTLIFAVINVVILQGTILPTFSKLEFEVGHKDIDRVAETIDRELYHLGTLVLDWAVWTDTWKYCQDSNKEYVESNLNDETMQGSHLNYLAVVHKSGKVLWSNLSLHGEDDNLTPITSDKLPADRFPKENSLLLKFQDNDKEKYEGSAQIGLIELQEGYLLVAARPVVKSDGTGPSNGTIIMGRFLDDGLVEKLINQTNVPFRIIPINSISASEKTIVNKLSDDQRYIVELKEGNLYGYTTYSTLEGDKAFLIESRREPSIIKRGAQTVRWALFLVTLSLLITIGLILYLIRKLFIIPLTKLTSNVKVIAQKGTFENRVEETRNDELGILAQGFNKLLEKLAFQHEDLRQVSIHDELTTVFNRKHIFSLLDTEVARYKRYKHDTSIMMIDLDLFKDVNDTHGHAIGDEVINTVAKSFIKTLRETDSIGRYGGEEFLVILPDQGSVGARCAAERVRKDIEALTFSVPDLKVTVSIGLCTLTQENADDAVSIADQNLYKAKEQGRNRTIASNKIE